MKSNSGEDFLSLQVPLPADSDHLTTFYFLNFACPFMNCVHTDWPAGAHGPSLCAGFTVEELSQSPSLRGCRLPSLCSRCGMT